MNSRSTLHSIERAFDREKREASFFVKLIESQVVVNQVESSRVESRLPTLLQTPESLFVESTRPLWPAGLGISLTCRVGRWMCIDAMYFR